MAHHSEGPWIASRSGILNSDGDNIFVQEDGVCWWKRPHDADLVSAAPDLLDALRTFLEEYVELVKSGDAGFWNPEEESKVIKARAAIARAEGGGA